MVHIRIKMRGIRKTFSASIEHLHDLVFDRFSDEIDSLPLGADYTGVIYREGYLFKQSRSMRKFWKTRYFVLRNDGILYYRSKLDKDGAPLGVIRLTGLSVHIDSIDNRGKTKFCLRLASRHFYFKTFCLCCFSQEERNHWLTALLTAISEELVSSYTLSKFRDERTLSVSSSDSGVSESNSSPAATLEKDSVTRNMPRTKSCELGSLFRVTEVINQDRLNMRRSSRSLGSLSEVSEQDIPDAATTSPKKEKKRSVSRFRRLKALSTLEFKNWRGSYIDLSCIGGS